VQKMVMGMPPGASNTYTSSIIYMAQRKKKENARDSVGDLEPARADRCASHTHTPNYGGGPTLVNDYY
jgi:hypothetical protein